MFGNVRDPASPDTVEVAPAKPMSPLGEQAKAFFAGKGGKVSVASAPRPGRPGRPEPLRTSPARSTQPAAPELRSPFGPLNDNTARAREAQMAAEADIIDDAFDDAYDCDAPGC